MPRRPIELVGVEVGHGRYHPGERVPVTLYWQAEQPLRQDYQLFIQFLDENGREVANLTSHPGWGRNPEQQVAAWRPVCRPYQVLVRGPLDASSPLLARVYTGPHRPCQRRNRQSAAQGAYASTGPRSRRLWRPSNWHHGSRLTLTPSTYSRQRQLWQRYSSWQATCAIRPRRQAQQRTGRRAQS